MAYAGICALCRRKRSLVGSHVFPEFLYDDLYDRWHKYDVRSTVPDVRISRHPIGLYEPLLCCECDQGRLGQLDDYAAKVLKCGIRLEVADNPDCVVVSGLDYHRFKLFEMSILWRCGVAKRREFDAIDLGLHAERLRTMLLEENPGEPHEYGATIVLPSAQQITKLLIQVPEPIRIHGHRCYRAVFGKLFWFFVVSSHSAAFPFQEGFLSEQGTLSIFKEGRYFSEFLLKLGGELGAFGEASEG